MSRKVLTLKYRPQTLDELWIQDHVRDTLKRAIERNRLANAYLFCGPRGVGKTTTARILAKSLNCEKGPTVSPCGKCSACVEIAGGRSLDVIEIDGALNRKIDDVRELRENIKYLPTGGKCKVYIIDEVHMLTTESFNALLKTLEEPPAHAKFIFATTAAHDVPATIVSRCQRFDFRRATPAEIKQRLDWLADREKIKASDAALMAIARRADGAIRDAEGILDQLTAYRPGGIELGDVEELLGLVPAALFSDYADLVLTGDAQGLMRFLARLFDTGYDHMEFYSGLVQHFRTLLVLEVSGRQSGLGLLPEEEERLSAQASAFGRSDLVRILSGLTQIETQAKATQHPRALLEVTALDIIESRSVAARAPADPVQTATEGAPDPPRTSDQPMSPDALWAELRLRINEHKPMLVGFLDLGRPLSLSGDTLTIVLPARQKAAAEKIEANLETLDAALTDIAGRKLSLVVKVATKPGPDPVHQRVTRILGDVEETEKP